MHMPIS
jgi:hypothetical protein